MNFKFYNLNITQNSKSSWENGEIKNPRFSLKGLKTENLTIDEVEEFLIESIRNSFNDLRDVMNMNEFAEAKVVMPSFQMCSVDKVDVVDFGINVIPILVDDNVNEEYIEEESLSDWNHPSEMWEEFARMNDEDYEEEDHKEYEGDSYNFNTGEKISENELDIIKKKLGGI